MGFLSHPPCKWALVGTKQSYTAILYNLKSQVINQLNLWWQDDKSRPQGYNCIWFQGG